MAKGVSDAVKISDGGGNASPWTVCFSAQVDKRGVNDIIGLHVFYTVNRCVSMCDSCSANI